MQPPIAAAVQVALSKILSILKLLADGINREQILAAYPDLEPEDINQCIHYAALLADERASLKAS